MRDVDLQRLPLVQDVGDRLGHGAARHQPLLLLGVQPRYDAAGNRTSVTYANGVTDAYTWDARGHMVLADAGGNVVTMTYNALGQRISKDASSGTTYFRYDGNNLLQETDSGGNVSRSYTTTDEEYGDLISEHEGFAVNEKKRRVLRQNSSQRVTGIVVNAAPGVPREVRRRLLAALHRARQSAEGITPQMAGMVAYVQMVNPAQAAVLRRGMQSSS